MQTYTKSLYETWPSQIEDQSLLEKYDSINSEWRAVAEKVMGLYQQYRSTGNELYLEQAKEIIYNEDTPLQTEMGDAATDLDTFLEKSMAEERTRIENSVKGTFFAIIAAMVAATIGVLVLAFALIRNVTGPTEEVRNALVGFSEGNMDIPVTFKSKNELGDMCEALRTSQHVLKEVIADECYLLEEMANGNFDVHSKNVDMYVGVLQSVLKSVRVINGNLSDTLSQIGVSAEQVSAGSEQVSNGAQALAQGATEQASAVQELSATISDLDQKAQENAETARVAKEKADQSGEKTQACNQKMQEMRQAMSDAGLTGNDIHKVLMVGGSSRIPAVQEMVKKLTGKEGFKGINPDECVAMGAALQAGVLTGDVKGLLLLDVTPLSLGIETMGGVCTKLIDRNTTIPVKKSQIFSTAADNQTSVEVNVLQGEREMAAANKSLGRFHLDGIAPARRGVPQIEVTFDIDANGIVNVSAKDLGTGTEQHITITSSSNMSKEDIEKAVKDAEQYAAEDAKIKEKVEVRNQADQMVYQSEKTLGEVGDKIPADEKAKVQSGIDKLKEVLKGDDTDAIKSATEELTQMFYQMSEKLYQQANPQGGAQAGPDMGGQNGGAQTGPNGQQYYDADYKVVDDDENNKK